MTIQHKTSLKSDKMLHRLQCSGRTVRFWFNAMGDLVGVWESKAGRCYAVGHNQQGQTLLYPASSRLLLNK